MKTKVKYTGGYEGTVPWCGLHVKPGEVTEVENEIALQLVRTGQFEIIAEEVNVNAKTSSDR